MTGSGSERYGWTAARWGLATTVVLAVHFGGAWAALHWMPKSEPEGEPPAAVMIELAPLPVSANNAPQNEAAPGPEVAEAKLAEEQVQSEVADNEPPPPPPEPQPEPEPQEIQVPEVEKKAEVVLPAAPRVDPQKEREKERKIERERQKRVEQVRERERERKREREREREKKRAARAKALEAEKNATAQRTSAPSGAPGPRSPSAASASAGASSAAMSSWRGSLMAHLNRHKRFPGGASAGGTVVVAFSINRSGGVTGARLARSSGDSVLDSEAVATVRRASPVPAPPDHIAGSQISLSVPIRYNR